MRIFMRHVPRLWGNNHMSFLQHISRRFPAKLLCTHLHANHRATMAFQLKKVLISDEVDPKCVAILRSNGIEVVKDTSLAKKPDQLIEEIKKYDGLIVRSATKVTAAVIAAADNLKIIGRAGTGVDNIDCDAATKKGVIVMNTPGGNTLSAAELTCTLMLAVSRHISQGTASLKAGRWDRKKFMGNELNGKTLGIIGLGRIGEKVAERMQSFGMRTIGYDPIIPGEESAKFGVEWMTLEKLWSQVDYITVHTPLIPQTKNLINDDVFDKCKKGVRVVNCARGGIIDEDALLRALESGRCGGAGLDVFVEEPPTNTALIEHPLVTSTPHLGASTEEAQSRVAEEIAQQFVDAVQGKSLFGALNAQALVNALSPDTKPWISLATAFGKIAAAFIGQQRPELTLQVQGPALAKAGSYLSASVLTGLLSQAQSGLNLVSAPAIAKEQGIKVAVTTSAADTDALAFVAGDLALSGAVGFGTPVLQSVDRQPLQPYTPLAGNVLLYKGKPGLDTLNKVAAALAPSNVSVLSFASTAGSESVWSVVRLSGALASTDALKSIVDVAITVAI